MITEFQDGFITKTKLNELVGGINNNTERLAELDVIVLTENVTKTVGSGGDFTTLNLAINWCKKVIPNGYKVTLQLMAGFVWSENISLDNVNLSNVEITSVDSVVNATFDDTRFAVWGKDSQMPKWSILLQCLKSTINGMRLDKCDIKFSSNCGIINGNNNLLAFSSRIYSDGTILAYYNTGSNSLGVCEFHSGTSVMASIHCSNLSIVGSEFMGSFIKCKHIFVNDCGVIHAVSLSPESYANLIKLTISSSSTAFVTYSSGTFDLYAHESSRALIGELVKGVRYINSTTGSSVDAHNLIFTKATVSYGGIISASGSTGTLSQTANTITADGIIFK